MEVLLENLSAKVTRAKALGNDFVDVTEKNCSRDYIALRLSCHRNSRKVQLFRERELSFLYEYTGIRIEIHDSFYSKCPHKRSRVYIGYTAS